MKQLIKTSKDMDKLLTEFIVLGQKEPKGTPMRELADKACNEIGTHRRHILEAIDNQKGQIK